MPRGRPRSFDRDEALRSVMEVFWAKGYDCTQLTDLTAAIGVTPPSFYAAFGSKEAAFREAVALYKETVGAAFPKALESGKTTCDSIRAMLEASIDVAVSAPRSAGCLLITGALNGLPENDPLSELLRQNRQENIARIRVRLERGLADGDIPPESDIPVLARFYGSIIQAISMQARDGMSRKELKAGVAPALAALCPQ